MRKLLILIIISILFVPFFAPAQYSNVLWNTLLRGKLVGTSGAYIAIDEITLGSSYYENGCIYTYVLNKSGATLTKGMWVNADNAQILVADTVARTAAKDTLTIANSLVSEGYCKVAMFPFSIADACSLDLTGIDKDGDIIVDTIVTATDDALAFSSTVWDTISQAIFMGSEANDSVAVLAYSINGVMNSTSNSTIVMGIVADDSIKDNAAGKICIYGIADYALINASSTTGLPGYFIEANGTGNKADPNASITAAGSCCGILLEATDIDGTARTFIINK